jgi:dephospho-CoA kinase
MRAFVVGVTGGIGSGKTTVCNEFSANHGVPVIDADLIAREVVEPGEPALSEIIETFGPETLDEHGCLDRAHLKRIVFADESKRKLLESLLHPRIRNRIESQVSTIHEPYCLLCIPLLAEGNENELIDRVLVVDCAEALQISRVRIRDNLTEQEVIAIMRTQASREARLQIADDVIVNEGDAALLANRVQELHNTYVKLAASRA